MTHDVDGPARKITDVAVGVLIRPDGRFLLGSRPADKPYPSYWEFPGGKLEADETALQALVRELREELAIEVEDAWPWVTIEHVYPHAHVRLHFMRVTRWRGSPQSCEGQEFGWFDADTPPPEPLLPAAYPCLAWMALPPVLLRSAMHGRELDEWLVRLDFSLNDRARGVLLVEPDLEPNAFAPVFEAALAKCRTVGALLIVDASAPAWMTEQADGLHANHATFLQWQARPSHALVGATVTSRDESARAARLGLDYVVLDVPALDATPLAGIAIDAPLPVYANASGFNEPSDAMRIGAHGVIRPIE